MQNAVASSTDGYALAELPEECAGCILKPGPHRHVRCHEYREAPMLVADSGRRNHNRRAQFHQDRAAFDRRSEIRSVLHLVGRVPFGTEVME